MQGQGSSASERAHFVVVKLGGSLITGWCGDYPKLQLERVRCLACELARLEVPLILLHGTGTFGKPPALRHGYLDGHVAADRSGIVAQVNADLDRLTSDLRAALLAENVPVFSLPVAALVTKTPSRQGLHNAEIIAMLCQRNVVPLVSGGFVADEGGFYAYSSDDLAVDLAIALGAHAIVFATRARGVQKHHADDASDYFRDIFPDDGSLYQAICNDPNDVTGGMSGKVRAAFRAASCGLRTVIVDGRVEGNITAAIAGAPILGTLVHSDRMTAASSG